MTCRFSKFSNQRSRTKLLSLFWSKIWRKAFSISEIKVILFKAFFMMSKNGQTCFNLVVFKGIRQKWSNTQNQTNFQIRINRDINNYSKTAQQRLKLCQKPYQLLLFCFPSEQDGAVANGVKNVFSYSRIQLTFRVLIILLWVANKSRKEEKFLIGLWNG